MTQLLHNVFIGRQNFMLDFELSLKQIQEDQGQILSLEGPLGIGTSTLLQRYETILKQKQYIFFKAALKPHSQDSLLCFRLWAEQIIKQAKKNNIYFTPTENNILLALYKSELQRDLPYNANEFIQASLHTLKNVFQCFSNYALIFIIEDLHYAHADTLIYLNEMFENFEDKHALLLYTQTQQDHLPWQKDLNYNQHQLTPFNSDEILAFCKQHLNAQYIAPSVINVLLDHSKGNPLYLEKLLKHALDTNYIQIISNNDKQSVTLNKTKHSIPKDLSELLLSHFHNLPELCQKLLRHIVVYGYEGNISTLESYLSDHFKQDITQAMQKLFDEHFLDLTSSFPSKKYQFNHGLFYDLLNQHLPIAEQNAIHLDITTFLIEYQKLEDVEDLTFKIAYHAQKCPDEQVKTTYSYLAALKTFYRHQFQETLQHLAYIKHPTRYLNHAQQENFVIFYTKSLISSESLEHAQNFIEQHKPQLTFDKPIFSYLEAEIAHHQNQYKQIIDKTNQLNIDDPWVQMHFQDLLPMRLKSLLNQGHTDSTVFESLSALRTLQFKENDNKELQVNVWCKVILANNYSRKTSLAPALIYTLSQYPLNSFSVKTHIEINSDINRWYIVSGQYKEALLNVSKTTNLCEKHYLISQKYQAVLFKGVIHSFMGDFLQALDCYKTSADELYKLKNFRQSYNAFLYYVDCLMDQGGLELAKHELNKLSRYKNLDKSDMNIAIEHVITGLYAFYTFDYQSAEQDFLKSSVHYQNANFTRAAYTCLVRALIMRTLTVNADKDYLENNYKSLHRTLHKNTLDISCTIYLYIAYYYCSMQVKNLQPPTQSIDIKTIQDIYTKQWIYISKINYFKHLGQFSEARQLIDEYCKVRYDIALNVPDHFKKDFVNHPIFKVPSLS